jgi:hypothetical protein
MWIGLLAGLARAAMTSVVDGAYVELGAGGGAADGPAAALVVSVGGWRGQYDSELAFGRYWGGGLTVRQDAGDRTTTAWQLEARRGIDLIVAGLHAGVAAGPVVRQPGAAGPRPELGVSARVLGAAEFRRTPTWAVALRAEVGADAWSAGVVPAATVTLGLQSQFARRSP